MFIKEKAMKKKKPIIITTAVIILCIITLILGIKVVQKKKEVQTKQELIQSQEELINYIKNDGMNVENKDIYTARIEKVTTKEELAPCMKFVDNQFIAQLEINKQLSEFVVNQKKSWDNETEFIKDLFEKISESDIYKEYMATKETSYEDDRELWRKLYKSFIFNNETLDQVLEDQSLYWNDDKEIVDTFVLKTIKRFELKNGANQPLLPEFKDEEDQEFARRLFRRSILNADYYRHLISENTRNWDLDRIAFMDVIILQIALAEILSFPNIPVSVSLNEYVDIAKLYSTAKSGGFINGTLDGIVNQLKKEGKLTKN